MKILNLGCGTKVSDKPEVINIDWSIYLQLKRVAPIVPIFIKGKRLEKFQKIPSNIMVHNLAKGIPFESDSIDVVYHSHMLEHLDRDIAETFLTEVKRVLKPGGVHRIVVPDLEKACLSYISHISYCEENIDEHDIHDSYIATLLEQSIRKEASSTSKQNKVRRFFENLLLGDARRRGETHQWMYDKINLKEKLINSGYKDVYVQSYDISLIPKWVGYGLDLDSKGNQYKPGSLYVEALK